jgi:hypothetical protein
MRKTILAVILLAAPSFASGPVSDWALVDRNGIVVWVTVGTASSISERQDGPWVRTFYKVGRGWKYDGINFVPPGTSTFTVIISTP